MSRSSGASRREPKSGFKPQGFRTLRRGSCAALLLVCVGASGALRAEVAYSALENGSWRIYRQADAGSPPLELWGELGMDASAPVLSPDGGQVAFEVQGKGVLVCPAGDPSKCRTLQPPGGSAVRPAWNPATGELLFVHYRVDAEGEESDLVTTTGNLGGTSPLLLQTGNQDDPDVSPDGRFLVYVSAQTVSMHRAGVQVVRQLWMLDLETGIARQLLAGNSQDIHPDWSPSGQAIAFASDRDGELDIWVVKADGSGLRKITSGEGSKTWPAWSPDGKTILFTLSTGGRQDLWMIEADGTNLRPFRSAGSDQDLQRRDADWR